MITYRKRKVYSYFEIYIDTIYVGMFTASYHYDQPDFRKDYITVDLFLNKFLNNVPNIQIAHDWQNYFEEEIFTQNTSQAETIANNLISKNVVNIGNYQVDLFARRHAFDFFITDSSKKVKVVLVHDLNSQPQKQIIILPGNNYINFSMTENEDVIAELSYENLNKL